MQRLAQQDCAAQLPALLDALSTDGDTGLAWLEETIGSVRATAPDAVAIQLGGPFAGARRRLGDVPLDFAGEVLPSACGPFEPRGWGRDDVARACLLLAGVLTGAEPAALVDALFRGGDEGERSALVRALCLLPEPAAALATAQAAGRTNSLRLYAALALDNPYPACCYDDGDFNQLVLKCLFNGLPIGRVVGLPRRASPRLSHMCEDYHDERVAAGRTVPADIWLALVPHAGERGLAIACAQLDSGDARHQHYAAQALAERRDLPAVAAALSARASRQADPDIHVLMESGAPESRS